MLATAAFVLMCAAGADDTVRLELIAKGGMPKIGYYSPQKATMAEAKPETIKKAPEGLAAPMYGSLAIAGGVLFILDEPEGKPASLYIDSNKNGDLTDDPAAEWKIGNGKMYNGSAMVDIGQPGTPVLVNIAMYRFDKADPARAGLRTTLLYYRDYAYQGEISLGGRKVVATLSDEHARGDFRPKAPEGKSQTGAQDSGVTLLIDLNGNGKIDARGERFDAAEPFNIGGTTWELADITRDGSSFRIVKSSQTVAEVPLPPDHSVGKTIMAFDATDTEGKAVKFPSDYKGKVVLLDFWATWCGPCMAEMPNVVAAYDKFHKDGFEILGISLDNEKSISKMPDTMKTAKMTWRQIADGKGWNAKIAEDYVIKSIPATFLVDGTTGKVLGANLRGKALDEAVEKALKQGKGAN